MVKKRIVISEENYDFGNMEIVDIGTLGYGTSAPLGEGKLVSFEEDLLLAVNAS